MLLSEWKLEIFTNFFHSLSFQKNLDLEQLTFKWLKDNIIWKLKLNLPVYKLSGKLTFIALKNAVLYYAVLEDNMYKFLSFKFVNYFTVYSTVFSKMFSIIIQKNYQWQQFLN